MPDNPSTTSFSLNDRAEAILRRLTTDSQRLRIEVTKADRCRVIDFGVKVLGGLNAGLQLAEVCMGGLGTITLGAKSSLIDLPEVFVQTDHPISACLLSQYAGWKIATSDFFAMGSGPIRAAVNKEDLFAELNYSEATTHGVGVLETSSYPTESALHAILSSLPDNVAASICVAKTSSQAGNLQVVARSVETAIHKLHELHFPIETIVSACGSAPLPPVARNDLQGIGRTNDSILYGGVVHLWTNCSDDEIHAFGPQTPSDSSPSFGSLFIDLFQEAGHDFYALDKALFSPAVVVFHSLKSGKMYTFGTTRPDLLQKSFGS